jgi:hypothetical protein
VASAETLTALTVKATSTVDLTKNGTAAVTFTGLVTTVESVNISPKSVDVAKSGTQQFAATVTGSNNPAQTVTWSIVETNKHSGTTINSTGKLTVAAAETLTTLTVKATSIVDPTKSGTAAVTIIPMNNGSIVWKWGVNGTVLYEFTSGGKIIFSGNDDGFTYTVSGDEIEIKYSGTIINTPSYSISGNTLTISNSLSIPTNGTYIGKGPSNYDNPTSVTVSPTTVSVPRGWVQTFSTTVEGPNDPAQTVTWSIVEANKNPGTTIDASGMLTVAAAETLTKLTVKATSTVDSTISGTAAVTVTSAQTATLVGKWGKSGKVLYEFTSSGSILITGSSSFNYTISGTASSGTITTTLLGATTGTIQYSISGNVLTLSNSGGKPGLAEGTYFKL